MKPAVTWAVAAAAAVAIVGFLVVLASLSEDAPAADAIPVKTERYTYTPGSAQAINVTQGTRVVLHATSADVTHGFAIEGYGINEEIPAGEVVTIEFVADKPGDFTIYCTVFCGSGHPQHKGTLHVA